MKICILMMNNSFSGGTFVLYEHARRLQAKGHTVTIAFEVESASLDLVSYPGMEQVTVTHLSRLIDSARAVEKFDYAIATFWETAFSVQRIPARRYGYFVQGHEATFYSAPFRVNSMLVEKTLEEKGFDFFTISQNLAAMIKSFGNDATCVPNSLNFERFGPSKAAYPRPPGKLRILIEGAATSVFKNVPLMFGVAAAVPEVEVFYLGCEKTGVDPAWKIDREFIQVPYADVPGIYASCDILLKLSSVESFALPVLEMFASGGTAIVTNFTGHDEYIKDGQNARVVPVNDAPGAIQALRALVHDPEALARLRAGARRTCESFTTWAKSNDIFENALRTRLEKEPASSAPRFPVIDHHRDAFLDWQELLGCLRTLESQRLNVSRLEEKVAELINSPAFRLGRIATWPYRTLRSLVKP